MRCIARSSRLALGLIRLRQGGSKWSETALAKDRVRYRVSTIPLAALMLGAAFPLAAQDSTAREVVQPLPTPEVQRLNRALMELARRPTEPSALLEAGDASLALDDFDAAIGFYGRARDIAPGDARVALGLARVYLRTGRPVEAIPLLREAEGAGAPPAELLSDQALAFDLVGDQQTAQGLHTRAIALAPQNDEARLRLAINRAIAGDSDGFRSTLAPLIEARDPGAYRTQAFGLAILGDQTRAEAIVNASMPRDLALRINPYLAYMPRLTPAQQAGAANLGIFPRAADIGREDPRIARFAREGTVGSRLEPSGAPLGTPSAIVAREVAQATPAPTPAPRPTSAPAPAPAPAREDVSKAFADLGGAKLPTPVTTGNAVNIAAIAIPREKPPEPVKAEPPKPRHPSRIWVQLATGKDVDALGFDWRRLARRTDGLLDTFKPHVTPWGEANRLLAGPVANAGAARDLINALAAKGIETFAYTSPEGTEIQLLD